MSVTVEEVQSLILKTLDTSPNGEIADSRELQLNGAAVDTERIKAALASLLSKAVGRRSRRR
jgi:hypothetical protein